MFEASLDQDCHIINFLHLNSTLISILKPLTLWCHRVNITHGSSNHDTTILQAQRHFIKHTHGSSNQNTTNWHVTSGWWKNVIAYVNISTWHILFVHFSAVKSEKRVIYLDIIILGPFPQYLCIVKHFWLPLRSHRQI